MKPVTGSVPHFSLKPHPVVSMLFIFVLIIGLLTALSFFSMEEGTGEYRQKAIATIILTVMITLFLGIVATSKMWFSHLWKRNSNHSRHKNHTRHHPAVKEREFRKRR